MSQNYKNNLDFEGWKAIMEGVGYTLLATSFMERILGRFYLIFLPMEFILLVFVIFKMITAKQKEINNHAGNNQT
jgi:hypothetical protein